MTYLIVFYQESSCHFILFNCPVILSLPASPPHSRISTRYQCYLLIEWNRLKNNHTSGSHYFTQIVFVAKSGKKSLAKGRIIRQFRTLHVFHLRIRRLLFLFWAKGLNLRILGVVFWQKHAPNKCLHSCKTEGNGKSIYAHIFHVIFCCHWAILGRMPILCHCSNLNPLTYKILSSLNFLPT